MISTIDSDPLERTVVYWKNRKAMKDGYKIIANKGGTSSGKTYAIIQLLMYVGALDKTPTTTTVVGQDLPNLKRGAIRDIDTIINSDPFWEELVKNVNRSNHIYTLVSGSIIEFTSYDNEQDAKNGKRNRLFLNEANGIYYNIFDQLYTRTTDVSILDWNPSSEFWYEEHLAALPECKEIQSTYKDNRHCPKPIVDKIESRAEDPKFENWYRVYGLGLTGRLEGTIFTWEESEFPDNLDNYFYGLDWGFSNSYLAITEIAVTDSTLYVNELFYQRQYTTPDIIEWMNQNSINTDQIIYCDAENPEGIEQLVRAGYKAVPTKKGKGSVKLGIELCQVYDIFVNGENLVKEMEGYVWAKDKAGEPLNTPIQKNDHLIDSFRGAVYTHMHYTSGKKYYNKIDDYNIL